MRCPYNDVECAGVADGDRRWQCPVLDAALTQPLTDLCRTRLDYFQKWKQHGFNNPGVKRDTADVAKKPSGCGGCGDKKKALTLMGEAWDVVKAVGKFVGSLGQLTSMEEYKRRLDICTVCENRGDERVRGNPHRCGECGCYVAVKAQAVAWECPIGKWETTE